MTPAVSEDSTIILANEATARTLARAEKKKQDTRKVSFINYSRIIPKKGTREEKNETTVISKGIRRIGYGGERSIFKVMLFFA